MALNKTEAFEEVDQELAALAKAIAHPARVAILKTLAERGACVCGQVVEVLPLAQATVSQHLKELKEAGLIRGDVDGPRMCYCIDYAVLDKARKAWATLFDMLELGRPAENACC